MAAYLTAYRQTGNASAAAKLAGINRDTPYKFAERHPDHPFSDEWRQAHVEAVEALELVARQRAMEGLNEPVFGNLRGEQGQNLGTGIVGHVRRPSDTLLIFLLKAMKPEVYRERFGVDVSGTIVTESEADRDLASALDWYNEAAAGLEVVARRAEGPGEPAPQGPDALPPVGS
jgi:hypothetical protein